MRYLISFILLLTILFSSGCQRFSKWDWGWITENRKYKTGFIDTDLQYDNALSDTEDKQTHEEFLKEQGFVFGIRIEQKF